MTTGHEWFLQFCHEEALPGEGGAGHAVVGVEATASLPAAGLPAGLLLLDVVQELQHVRVQPALEWPAQLARPACGVFNGAVRANRPRTTKDIKTDSKGLKNQN